MVPAPGETRCVIVEFPPDETMQKINDWEAVGEEYAVKLPGLAELFEPDAPGMHTTPTVDYIVVLSGELSLEVDNGVRRDLKVGDVIIQNGTRHAWRNTSNAPARILSVMIGAVS
jgi:mannose-6-phosphate isomerase-like protein (cupin superfamily)